MARLEAHVGFLGVVELPQGNEIVAPPFGNDAAREATLRKKDITEERIKARLEHELLLIRNEIIPIALLALAIRPEPLGAFAERDRVGHLRSRHVATARVVDDIFHAVQLAIHVLEFFVFGVDEDSAQHRLRVIHDLKARLDELFTVGS